LIEQNKKQELLLLNGDSLHLLDSKTGSIHYSYPWKDVGSDPLIYNNSVFLSNFNDGAILLDITQNPPELIWKNDSAKGLFQGFVRYEDYVYGFANKKQDMPLRCINLQNGEIEWETNLDKWGSLIVANDKLVIITGKGKLIVAETSPEKYTEISSRQIFDITEEEFKKNRNCCWTKPVLSHGKIYTRTVKGELACVDVSI
jgi:outer membrane protein assembly factor BamB